MPSFSDSWLQLQQNHWKSTAVSLGVLVFCLSSKSMLAPMHPMPLSETTSFQVWAQGPNQNMRQRCWAEHSTEGASCMLRHNLLKVQSFLLKEKKCIAGLSLFEGKSLQCDASARSWHWQVFITCVSKEKCYYPFNEIQWETTAKKMAPLW